MLTHRPGDYNPNNFSGAGHWTQVVWKGTKTVGCAAHKCPKGTLGTKPTDPWEGNWYYVCNYDPAVSSDGASLWGEMADFGFLGQHRPRGPVLPPERPALNVCQMCCASVIG